MSQLYSYTVKYRRGYPERSLLRTLIVGATDADDAREEAARIDPLFDHTTESPRRGRPLDPPDGMDLAKAREFAQWRDTDVEVVP